MPSIMCGTASLAVASLFYVWRAYRLALDNRLLRERVAYMLWVTATGAR